MPEATRPYRKRRRAEQEKATRTRIVEATVHLHRTVGPARTTISAIAERAGVQRLTVYRHFPDERELFAACGQAFGEADPPPDPGAWTAIDDRDERLRTALRKLYAWYARNADMLANVERDAPRMPALAEAADSTPYVEAMKGVLRRPGRRRKLEEAALGHALAFSTWHSLTQEGLSDREAVEVIVGLVGR
jgi:AcrR family transcriptional regulator